MKLASCLLAGLGLAGIANSETYFHETFGEDWEDRWVVSDWKQDEGTAGKWTRETGPWYGDAEADFGLKTSEDAKFYAISSKLTTAFTNTDKDLVVQFQVRFPQKIDCGGGYIKVLYSGLDQANFDGESKYAIMFGPDICGTSTKRVHAIFYSKHADENLLIKKEVRAETDQLSHVYTLIVHPDETYEIRVDGKKKQSGNIGDDWDFLVDEEIKDPEQSKPKTWVDEAKIVDPDDEEPSDWNDEPERIPDPEAEKPDDWEDDEDGDWEAPEIDNPNFKGAWNAKKIDNPDYKGPWEHPLIPNPDFVAHEDLHLHEDLEYVGIELWQVKAGTIFDNIIITDDIAEADALLEATFEEFKDAEKTMFDDVEEAKRKKEEEERKAREAAEAEEEDEDDDEDDIDDDDDDEDDDDDDKEEL